MSVNYIGRVFCSLWVEGGKQLGGSGIKALCVYVERYYS